MRKNKYGSVLKLNLKNKSLMKSYLFLIPLLFGLIFFFIIPVVKSMLFSVSDVTSGPSGYKMVLKGFSSY